MTKPKPYDELSASQEYKSVQKAIQISGEDHSAAVDALCQPIENSYEENQDPEAVEASLWRVWQSVTSLAAETASDSERQRLVDFVLMLQKRPDVESSGSICKVWDAVVWRDLPVLGAQMREAWNETAEDHSSKESQTQWLNLNAFTASLVQAAHSNADKPDLSLFGLWTIRTALEETPEKPDDISLKAATIWFEHAGAALEDLSKQGKTFDGKVAKPGFAHSKEDWRGFTTERRDVWQHRLDDLK